MRAGQTTSYAYDGDGVRLQQSVGGTVTKLLWDVNHGLPQLALERDGSNNLLRRYLYGQQRISLSTPSQTSYYHADKLGSVANVTSADGTKEWTYAYEPFGTSRTSQQDDGSAPANAMRFTGELLDGTGLYHLRARQYDPSTGLFSRVDPVAIAPPDSSVSSYAYGANRPITMVDPSGCRSVPSEAGSRAISSAVAPAVQTGARGSLFRYYPAFGNRSALCPKQIDIEVEFASIGGAGYVQVAVHAVDPQVQMVSIAGRLLIVGYGTGFACDRFDTAAAPKTRDAAYFSRG